MGLEKNQEKDGRNIINAYIKKKDRDYATKKSKRVTQYCKSIAIIVRVSQHSV